MIELHHVSKRYFPGPDALLDVSVKIPKGMMAFLTGRSGAGKSTFLKLISGLDRPTSGQIRIAGRDLNRLNPRQLAHLRRKMGLVFQEPHLLMDRTVSENVALPLIISGVRQDEIPRRVRAALHKVGLLNKERSLPSTLSAGERQRVGIARAVVNKPILLVADEPTGNLDPELSFEILNLFEAFNNVGTTVLIASHDHELIRAMNKPVLSLSHGRLLK